MIGTRVPTNFMTSRFSNDLADQQIALSRVQEQISTGKQVNRPSDAPGQSAHLLTMEQTQDKLTQFTENAGIAESQLSLEEGALVASTDTLNRIRELTLQANSGVFEGDYLETIQFGISQELEELYSIANSQDSFGNYLFSGTNNELQPFSVSNPVTYAGNDDSRKIEITSGRSISTGDSGLDVFMRIRNGNGDFVTDEADTNTGTGIINQGSVTDLTLFDGSALDISFTNATTFDVTDRNSGAVVLSAQTFESGAPIEVAGMSVNISGAPAAGDTFTLDPSQNQDVFSSVTKLIDTLGRSPADEAGRAIAQSDVNRSISDIDNALDHLNIIRSSVGSRLNSVDNSREENANLNLQLERTKQDIEDVDITDAVTRLQSQTNSLEILQATYARVEGLSLFNYL